MADGLTMQFFMHSDEAGFDLSVRHPIATQELFHAVLDVISERLERMKQPSAGEIEMASWAEEGDHG